MTPTPNDPHLNPVPSPDAAHNDAAHADPGHESPRTAAAERWAHGLLEFMHRDTPLEQERRVARVMSSVDSAGATRVRFTARLVRFAAVAAVVVFTAGLFSLLFKSENTALATIRSAVAASRSAGVSRFAITVTPNDSEERAIGTLDTNAGDRSFLLEHKTPQGHTLIAGRDAQGEWTIKRDGAIDREHPRGAWPPWAFLTDSTVVVGSIDDMLAELETRYNLQITRDNDTDIAPGATADAARLRHIRADAQGPGPLPGTIDLWIDPTTNLVQLMELRWNPPPNGAPGAGRPGAGPGPEGRPGPSGPRPGAITPDDPFGLARPDPDRPGGPDRPSGPDRNGPGRPDGPGRPGAGRPDGPPPGGPEGQGRPDGPGGHNLMDGPRRGPGPGPGGPEGARRPGPGADGQAPGQTRPNGPPRLIRFQRQPAPELPENWFSPEAHRPASEPAR
ncbi:MAG: hypothetical protein ACREJO_10980 [Phycisphaerales bacterium]